MASWQRGLRFGLGAFLLVFGAGLFLSLRHSSSRPDIPPSVPKADPKAVVEGSRGRLVLSKGTRLDVAVDYDRLLTYPDGGSRLTGVRARIPQRGGRDFAVRAREGSVTHSQDSIALSGDVEITASDGLAVRTGQASYGNAEGIVRAPGPVSFARGRTTGSATGMTYDKGRDVLWLLERAVIRMAPDARGAGAATVEAGAAGLARRDNYMRFERGVEVRRGGETINADEAMAYLTDDGERLQTMALRGSSRVRGRPGADGGLKAMTARDIDLSYAPDGQTLQHAVLNGAGAIELAGAGAGPGRRIAGEWIDITLAPDGVSIVGLAARDRVQLDLPAERDAPARSIRAAEVNGAGEPGKGLTSARFTGGGGLVEFREVPKPPAAARSARSDALELAMPGGLGALESAHFTGGVRFEDADLTATGGEARYGLATGSLGLSGTDPQTGRPPQVNDVRATIEAHRIDIGLDGRKIVASEAVKSEMRPATSPGQAAARLPAMLDGKQPVFATSDSLDYQGGASRAAYTGHARLWQGDTTIKADKILLDDREGDLTAAGSVVTTMRLTQVDEGTKEKEEVSSVASAKEMVYQDDARRLRYTSSAHLNGPQGDLSADRIDLYLKEGGREADRLEADGTVGLKTPDGRKANGSHLTYESRDERYVMTGQPVTIVEECRETTGKTLTFFRSAGRILVDGNEQKRTETRGVSACGPVPRSPD